jgi:glycosyltransferase involved in cell wall biosynthesis
MHVLFLHQNFPAQFGMIAAELARQGSRVTFVSRKESGTSDGIERIRYEPQSGATARTHYSSRSFENLVWHSHAVYDALKARPDIVPDLIVGHSGYVSTVLLRELYDCPIVNYFEYYYHTRNSDMDFRPEAPPADEDRLRAHFRNGALLVDLANCDAGYSPTRWQRDQLPSLFHPKVRVIFDGVDTGLWRPQPELRAPGRPRQLGGFVVPPGQKLVTYVSRGFESIRGFDIFMKVAKRLYQRRGDVRFLVVGRDRVCYGGDEKVTGGKSFKDWVLSQDDYDLSRFAFVGNVSPPGLAQVFAISDAHIYLTVPFVLSWSLMNALACGAVVVASRTAPVCEIIEHERNGLLADFFDVDGLADQVCRVLDRPSDFEPVRATGVEFIRSNYSLEVCLPQLRQLFQEVTSDRSSTEVRQ